MAKEPIKIELEDKLPWERQIDESSKAFLAFTTYRDSGRERTLASTAIKLGKSHFNIAKYSRKWNWKKRVQEWDNELDRQKREGYKKGIEDMVIRHVKTAQIFERGLTLPATALMKKMQKDPNCIDELERMSVADLISKLVSVTSALDTVVDIERKSRGKPTEINATDVTSDGKRIHVVLPVIPPKID